MASIFERFLLLSLCCILSTGYLLVSGQSIKDEFESIRRARSFGRGDIYPRLKVDELEEKEKSKTNENSSGLRETNTGRAWVPIFESESVKDTVASKEEEVSGNSKNVEIKVDEKERSSSVQKDSKRAKDTKKKLFEEVTEITQVDDNLTNQTTITKQSSSSVSDIDDKLPLISGNGEEQNVVNKIGKIFKLGKNSFEINLGDDDYNIFPEFNSKQIDSSSPPLDLFDYLIKHSSPRGSENELDQVELVE